MFTDPGNDARPGHDKALTPGIVHGLAEYQPVIALTLLRETPVGRQVLVGVRTAAHNTHQDVLSVPTIRIPRTVGEVWRAALPPSGELVLDDALRATRFGVSLDRAVRRLLRHKLGAGPALAERRLDVRVDRLTACQGSSLIGSQAGRDVTEELTMFNAEVVWRDAADPDGTAELASTVHYDPLLWVDTGLFLEVVETRDVGLLDAPLDEILVCVRGLCIDTTVRTLVR